MLVVDCMDIFSVGGNNMKIKYYYDVPNLSEDEDGNVIIIHKYSIAPIEYFTYGITFDKHYFLKWEYPLFGDDELVCDYRLIPVERLLDVISKEIDNCQEHGNNELAEKFMEAKNYIETLEHKKE